MVGYQSPESPGAMGVWNSRDSPNGVSGLLCLLTVRTGQERRPNRVFGDRGPDLSERKVALPSNPCRSAEDKGWDGGREKPHSAAAAQTEGPVAVGGVVTYPSNPVLRGVLGWFVLLFDLFFNKCIRTSHLFQESVARQNEWAQVDDGKSSVTWRRSCPCLTSDARHSLTLQRPLTVNTGSSGARSFFAWLLGAYLDHTQGHPEAQEGRWPWKQPESTDRG